MNPSTKRANKRWQGSHVQGYAKALIHLHIENFQEDYTIQEIPKSVISTIRSDHINKISSDLNSDFDLKKKKKNFRIYFLLQK